MVIGKLEFGVIEPWLAALRDSPLIQNIHVAFQIDVQFDHFVQMYERYEPAISSGRYEIAIAKR